jgi:hypothetical protein
MSRDKKIVDFPKAEVASDERAHRLKVEVERLANQSPTEWMFWLDGVAEQHGVPRADLKAMIETTIKVNEKKAREDKAEDRQREQRAQQQRTAERREGERQQRRDEERQRREQERADREARERQRERDRELASA